MAKNVKSFKGKNYNDYNQKGHSGNQNTYFNKDDMNEEVKAQFDKYSKFSENQLMDEFYREAERQKKLGNLNPQMLENFYNMMAPNMTKEQQKKMKAMINSIK